MWVLLRLALACSCLALASGAQATVRFGLFDTEVQPGGGWRLMTVEELNNRKAGFIASYNRHGGIAPVKQFKSGNCCIGVAGGKMLGISGTRYNYQFPAARSGGIRCNPTGGYTEPFYKFYRVESLKEDMVFSAIDACEQNHNVGLYVHDGGVPTTTTTAAPTGPQPEFGYYDLQAPSPGAGWHVMSIQMLRQHRAAFVAAYNQGLVKPVKTFKTGNCCVALQSGRMLHVQGSSYGYVFPAISDSGAIRCNPTAGYNPQTALKFYRVSKILPSHVFSETTACTVNHNPALMMRMPDGAQMTQKELYTDVQFGIYGLTSTPPKGWIIASAADLEKYKFDFVHKYNQAGGLPSLGRFRSGNCCIALRGGFKLTVSASSYGYVFPASASGAMRCNPTDQYAEPIYHFFQLKQLSMAHQFAEKKACATSNNPAIWMKLPDPKDVEFGLYDAERTPPGLGWELMSIADFEKHRLQVIEHYTANRGFAVIAPFRSGNCCIAVAGGKKLVINGTPYGFQFPASSERGEIRCNPSEGYKGIIAFFKVPTLGADATFTQKDACKVNHNPAIYMRDRRVLPPTPAPTQSPTPSPTPPLDDLHCKVGAWSAFGACSKTCGWGRHTRTRSIVQRQQLPGQSCPQLTHVESCHDGDCPTDCSVSKWGAWEECNAQCGGGQRVRHRDIEGLPDADGAECPELTETGPCNTMPCPQHCEVGPWGAWGECSKTCAGGQRTRTRSVTVEANNGGNSCPPLVDTPRHCNTHTCAVHCAVSSWSVWSGCTEPCGGGTKSRRRVVTRIAQGKGADCPPLEEKVECHTQPCAIDCVLSTWGAWSACDKSCGAGQRTRTRSVSVTPAHGGKPCETPLEQAKDCYVVACPIDCVTSSWSNYGPCSKSCGRHGGTAMRTRHILIPAKAGGVACGTLNVSRTCNVQACPEDCTVSDWGSWTACSTTCGAGKQTRTREMTMMTRFGGLACPVMNETRSCSDRECPKQDCLTTKWSAWSTCTKSCTPLPSMLADSDHPLNKTEIIDALTEAAVGHRSRTRSVTTLAANGGAACGKLLEREPCNVDACPVDCAMSAWSGWSECSATCASGTRTRTRRLLHEEKYGGMPCSNTDTTESQVCDMGACPRHCDVGQWGSWSPCTHKCAFGNITGGTQHRARSVIAHAEHGGYACPMLLEARVCNTAPCAVNCKVSTFGAWGNCSQACGGGVQTSVRTLLTPAQHGGSCPALSRTRACNTAHCAVDCAVSSFFPWSGCSSKCGGGVQTRSRVVIAAPRWGGGACPSLSQTKTCNDQDCPVDCIWSEFGAWSECSTTCGTGAQTRHRTVMRQVEHGGRACTGQASETQACSTMCCPGTRHDGASCTACTPGRFQPSVGETFCSFCPAGKFQNTSGASACITCSQGQFGAADAQAGHCVDCPTGRFQAYDGSVNCVHCPADKFQPAEAGSACMSCPAGKFTNGQAGQRSCSFKPVNCVASQVRWSACSMSCNKGTQTGTRTVIKEAQHGGRQCTELVRTRTCNHKPCPVDCEVGSWSSFTACSKTCGAGMRTRRRATVMKPWGGGVACPTLVQASACNTQLCPDDCEVGSWGSFSTCTKTCGGGQRTRHRFVVKEVKAGGIACAALDEHAACGDTPCPTHCTMTSWSSWTNCSKTCESGTQTRLRKVAEAAAHGGISCPPTEERRFCNEHACPVDCVLGNWGFWGDCSRSCANGTQVRTRSVVTPESGAGAACASLEHRRDCNIQPCPVDCAMSTFTPWSACTVSCGGGIRSRSRSIVAEAQHGGVACAANLSETTSCNTNVCSIACVVSDWGTWQGCSASCNSGLQNRARSVIKEPSHGGTACPGLAELRRCNEHACPHDCIVGNASRWTTCTHSCGTGSQERRREVQRPAAHGGAACPADQPLHETRNCNAEPCPSDCVAGPWSPWSTCTLSCGKRGSSTRSRSILSVAQQGGKACAHLSEVRSCNEHACAVDCALTMWSDWGHCSVSCGSNGTQVRSRMPLVEAMHGGTSCSQMQQTQNRSCSRGPCPFKCKVTAWTDWSPCTKTCGGGVHTRKRNIEGVPTHGGYACPTLTEERVCNEDECPQDCKPTDWTEWSTCSKSCGRGHQSRTRSIAIAAVGSGAPCPHMRVDRDCNVAACPLDCELEWWNAWSNCTKSCADEFGPGSQMRSRALKRTAEHGGKACASRTEERKCATHKCPIDCVVSSWSQWTECTKECASGLSRRFRYSSTKPRHGGKECPALTEAKVCNTHHCPVNCALRDWASWSSCSTSCGAGVSRRERMIQVPPSFGGLECAVRVETEPCDAGVPCPVDCNVALWGNWHPCSVSCGAGTQIRTRQVKTAPIHGGVRCPVLNQTRACHERHCAIHCTVSDWASWSTCDRTCGGTGQQTRSRSVVSHAKHGGYSCPHVHDWRHCASAPCPTTTTTIAPTTTSVASTTLPSTTTLAPVDCKVTIWDEWLPCTKACGGGTQSRLRQVVTDSQFGGVACPALEETRYCNTQSCKDCKVTSFSAWSACSATCGTKGSQRRTRNVIVVPELGGASCPPLSEHRWCGPHPCPVHCIMSKWLAWSNCDQKCGGGSSQRIRYVTQKAKHGGRPCPAQTMHKNCNVHECPVDCTVGDYSNWSRCSRTCGGGKQTRARQIITPARNGGVCLQLNQTQACGKSPCPVPCRESEWGSWTTCTAACGKHGTQSRSRTVAAPARFNGAPCGPLTQLQQCNRHECGPPAPCRAIYCRVEEHYHPNGELGNKIRVLHRVNASVAEHEDRELHTCKYNKASSSCECMCFTADWALSNSPPGAIASCNMKIVSQYGGVMRFHSKNHGKFYCTDTTKLRHTGLGFVGSQPSGAFNWSVHHAQNDLGGGRITAAGATVTGQNNFDSQAQAAIDDKLAEDGVAKTKHRYKLDKRL